MGLGARFPDLREPSPAKIAAGFGGTLNLVVSAIYIMVTVICSAVPSYYWVEATSGNSRSAASDWFELGSTSMMLTGVLISLALGLLACVVPFVIGLRAFRRMEP